MEMCDNCYHWYACNVLFSILLFTNSCSPSFSNCQLCISNPLWCPELIIFQHIPFGFISLSRQVASLLTEPISNSNISLKSSFLTWLSPDCKRSHSECIHIHYLRVMYKRITLLLQVLTFTLIAIHINPSQGWKPMPNIGPSLGPAIAICAMIGPGDLPIEDMRTQLTRHCISTLLSLREFSIY